MKKWKKISLFAALAATLVVSGCSKEKEPASIDQVTEQNTSTEVKTEAEIKNAQEVKDYGRTVIGEFEKILYNLGRTSNEINKETIERYIKNPEVADRFYNYTVQYMPYNTEVKKISFNRNTEELYSQGGRYFYQVTAEAQYIRFEFAGIESFSYFLMINQDSKGNFYVEDIRWEKGHLLDGYELLSDQGKEYVTKEKLEYFLKNALSFETTDKDKAIQNVMNITRGEELAEKFIEDMHFNSSEKRTLVDFVYDEDSFDVDETLLEGREGLFIVTQGKAGIVYKTSGGTEKKDAFAFKITLSQRNPSNNDYIYVIDDIIINPTSDFNWK